ncbi:hypothetical protein [Caldithrix abyssi]
MLDGEDILCAQVLEAQGAFWRWWIHPNMKRDILHGSNPTTVKSVHR